MLDQYHLSISSVDNAIPSPVLITPILAIEFLTRQLGIESRRTLIEHLPSNTDQVGETDN
jgi:hypothetical protein